MPDTTPRDTDARHPHADLPPPGSGKEASDTMERFADALDALVLGARTPDMHDASERSLAHLSATAGSIQRQHGTAMGAHGPVSATPIGATRKRQIWEDLMTQHARDTSAATTPTAQASTIGRLGALMQPWIAIDDERTARGRKASTGLLSFVSDPQPVMTFALVIAVLIAVGAGFSAIVEPGGPGVTPTASAEGLAGLTGETGPATPGSPATQATSPAAVPTADSTDEFQQPIPTSERACSVEPRPLEEIAAILRDPGPVTPRAYLPATPPDREIAEEVARAGRTYLACAYAYAYAYAPVNTDRALQTPRYIHEQPSNAYFRESGGPVGVATREQREQLGRLILGEEVDRSRLYLVTDLAISQEEYAAVGVSFPGITPSIPSPPGAGVPEQIDHTFRPEQAVQLADGRIAVPTTFLIDSADADRWLPTETMPDGMWFSLFIFAPDATQGGQWGLDEELPICVGNDLCEELYASEALANEPLFPAGTPSPVATPLATPDAAPAATPEPRARSRRGA